jgi:4-hydroxy-2-oxoheptanedioate aldolase
MTAITLDNPFKRALREHRVQIGLWQALANPYTAEICATAGFDWLLFDGEHGPNDIPLLLAQLQAVSAYSSHPVARPPSGDANLVKQYLDIGFTTLLIPFVESVEQTRALVRAVRYPPEGIRGVAAGIVRASRWNRVAGYLDNADRDICLLLQIETKAGLENLASIAATEGVDGIFVGPSDLSAALGHRGNPGHPDIQKAIAGAIKTICESGKAAGILASVQADAERYQSLGCTFIAVGSDVAILVRGSSDLAAQFQRATSVSRGGSSY